MILDKLFSKRSTAPSETTPSNGGFMMFQKPVAGITINDQTAETYAAYWSCIRGISESIACLPWHVMGVEGRNKVIAKDHSLFVVLNTMPNSEMNSFTFRELMVKRVLSLGNFYAEIERNRIGDVVGLWPIDNDRVSPSRDKSGRIIYEVSNEGQQPTTLKSRDMYHVRGPGNGLVGSSVVNLAKQSISLGIAAEQFGAGLFGNGGIPSGIITNDGSVNLSTEGAKNMLDTWNRDNRGAKKRGKTEYLEKGLDYKQLSINPDDAQFLETRKFQVHEIARWFRYPVHKLSEMDRSTHSNIEAQNIEFVTDTLLPWITRIEAQSNISLFKRDEVGTYFNKIKVQGLLRGDSKSRSEFYKTMFNMGVYSIDQILEFEDQNPLERDGDLRLVPMNMVSVENAKNGGGLGSKPAPGSPTQSHFKLFQNIARRFVTVETKRISSLSDKNDFESEAIKFYVKHSANIEESLQPALAVTLDAIGVDSSKANTIAAQITKDLVAESADSAHAAHKSGDIESLMHYWTTRKAEQVAEKIINEVVKHA